MKQLSDITSYIKRHKKACIGGTGAGIVLLLLLLFLLIFPLDTAEGKTKAVLGTSTDMETTEGLVTTQVTTTAVEATQISEQTETAVSETTLETTAETIAVATKTPTPKTTTGATTTSATTAATTTATTTATTIATTTSRIENVHDAIINSLSDSVSTTVSNYVISKLPFADEINIGIKMTKIAQKAISASMDVVENNTSINIELRQEAAGISVASTGAYVSMIADDTGSVEFQRAYFSPGLLQEKLAYFAYSMNDQTIHTYDEYIIESGSECLIADDLTENYSPDKWINTFVRNGGTEPLDASFNTFCRYLETAWNRYCVDSGNSQYANINIQRLSPVDIIELTMSLEKYGYQEINIDLSKYTQYLEDYN